MEQGLECVLIVIPLDEQFERLEFIQLLGKAIVSGGMLQLLMLLPILLLVSIRALDYAAKLWLRSSRGR
jgi:hypothetical protein